MSHDDHIMTTIFSWGWFNHQPATHFSKVQNRVLAEDLVNCAAGQSTMKNLLEAFLYCDPIIINQYVKILFILVTHWLILLISMLISMLKSYS